MTPTFGGKCRPQPLQMERKSFIFSILAAVESDGEETVEEAEIFGRAAVCFHSSQSQLIMTVIK